MTIYWERCSICGKYHAVKQCTMFPELMVCPHCCLACPHRSRCPRPVWYPVMKIKPVTPPAPKRSKEEARRVLLDLLSRLEEKK